MQVKRARTAGFCLGVSLALRTLDRELAEMCARAQTDGSAKKTNTRLITLGPIIHNPLVMREYEKKGVVCHDDPSKIRPHDRVIIRAHGIPVEVEESLAGIGADIVDATCPKVKKAQIAIAEQRTTGGTLLLFGEAQHPEVRGLISYAGNDAIVFGSIEELAGVELTLGKSYFMAAQTTQDSSVFAKAHAEVEARLGTAVPVLDTICNATRRRQEEVLALAREVDAIVIVGGRNSGNTRRLAEVARAQGIVAVHVEEAAELNPELLKGLRIVGLTAGASTPEAHINAMHQFLEKLVF